MKRQGKTIILNKVYGKAKGLVYNPLSEAEDINIEPLYLVKVMRKVQVEVLQNVEFCNGYGDRGYKKGIHSLDIDLAKLLVRCAAARFIIPHKEVPAAKASRH